MAPYIVPCMWYKIAHLFTPQKSKIKNIGGVKCNFLGGLCIIMGALCIIMGNLCTNIVVKLSKIYRKALHLNDLSGGFPGNFINYCGFSRNKPMDVSRVSEVNYLRRINKLDLRL